MQKTRIPSPARSQGATTTPRRKKARSSRSLCSPALSTASGRLTSLIDQFKDKNMESFALSPLNGRSVLNDNTDIDEPRRKSWWKKLDENSRDVLEVLEDNRLSDANNVVEELIDIDILSQEKKNYTLDLPESSDNESIHSIVLPQRRLFTQKENLPQKKFVQLMDNRESLAKLHKPNTTTTDKTVNVGTRELFQNKLSKPIFAAALLNISPNKTAADKTKENVLIEPRPPVRSIFGNRPANKRKNMFADFIVSESEDEIPEIQPKVFGFQKKLEQRRISSKGSPTSSITTDMEMDDWRMLPSSTMVENQIEDMMGGNTPVKRARLSKLSEAKESDAGTNTLQTNTTADKTKQSNKSASSKNKSKASPEIRNVSLNNSRTTRSMLKNATIIEENANMSLKQNSKANKSQTKTAKSDSNRSTLKVHNKPGTEDIEENQVDDENDLTLRYENDENEINEEATTITKDNREVQMNKSKNNKSTLSNKSIQKATKPGKIVEESVDSQNKLYSADDNVDGNVEQDPTVRDETEKSKEEISQEIEVSDQSEVDEANVSQDNVDEQNVSTEANESQEVENEEDESENEEEAAVDSDENEEANASDLNHESRASAAVNDSQEIDEQANESRIDDDNVASENEEDEEKTANESEVEEANESQEVESEAEVSQEVENDEEESQGLENEAEVSQAVENDEEESQELENEAEVSQDVENEAEISQEVENDQEDSHEVENDEEENEEAENDEEENEEAENDEEESREVENDEEESQEIENDEEQEQIESDAEVNQSEEIDNDQQMDNSDEDDKAIASDPEISEQDDDFDQADAMEVDDENDEQESENDQSHQAERQNEVEPSTEEIAESPDVTHDTTGRHRKKHLNKSPEVIRHDKTNQMDSFTATGRNTSVRKTKSMIKNLHIRPSLAPPRNSTGFSDGTTNSSAEGSGWDSHRTTRKTLRQTFGKDFTPRKSLRALVMEKSAKRQTEHLDLHSETVKFPQANSTELPEISNRDDVEDFVESDHEVSMRTRQTTLEMYLEKIKQQNNEKKAKMQELVRNSLNKVPVRDPLNMFKVPNKPAPRRPKPSQAKPKKQFSSIIAFDNLPPELKEDLKYKPPKRFQPSNASWITKRLYKFLETKLEPKYDYKARVRSEKLVETIYHFTKDLRRHTVAPTDAVDVLKQELARLDVVSTHFEFYEFFHDFMPREVRIKVVPDIVNKIPLPRHGVFSKIIRGNTP
ncbi:microtubule-associated protein futsch-like isoform X1 [Helicoverpa zea]|uniref:microtubule-associated protein futsch-like isoform X1 n=1 Tax=Helicoverpa zea TaxID=7113 RepID=UPI001F56FC45|nr:microtubule-associated protein futsch-like isoform X1 [Helicoverpa zea]